MIAIAKKTLSLPRAKITRAVEHILPKGATFKLHVEKSAVGGLKVVRIVTPAWKRLRPVERITRVREAVEGTLSDRERKSILRFSVVTPKEYKVLSAPPYRGSVRLTAAKYSKTQPTARS